MADPVKVTDNGQGAIFSALDQPGVEMLAKEMGRLALDGDVITMQGDLGAGKTTFTRAFARGLGVGSNVPVTSPTFAIIHEYQGRIFLYHVDLYRLTGEDDVFSTGLEEYLGAGGVTVIEWPDRLGTLMPDARLHIKMGFSDNEHRTLVLQDYGGQWRERLELLQKTVDGTVEK